jgi:peptide chain release factor 2
VVEGIENNAFLDIQAGAGGTEAQDWARCCCACISSMAEHAGFAVRDARLESAGEVAGIKSATLHVTRRVRLRLAAHRNRRAPAGAQVARSTRATGAIRRSRRCSSRPRSTTTSRSRSIPPTCASTCYRSSGAGGQHVNKTESAVRITHIPTASWCSARTSVQPAQEPRHGDEDAEGQAVRARGQQKRNAEAQVLEDAKSDVGWGSQIRSYVLDQSRIKDLRTGVEVGNPDKVLDGDLDQFMEASLKQGCD